ncbi:Proline and alanine rich protein EspI, component of Type VII secretion system ESX-1 [[Actinomadura] parvosata subsp. kistnae]|uniref:nucleotide-binding protein n=1 Tax=[Actinomadura] parvosata TaxID=1955412 RepID=UPI000D28B417|nr:AAA family ATPase [Nonomuraea sp. ATCC 55076]SPL94051.1 Proline and alanine rich protein EspI, component of Type VII secretion system ESX-1 [Actinomadura parvosata subsp. kistnae]
MARHDREESLEEQLAWLDAIKESDEEPVPVSASAVAADEPVASPYPQDPWSLVPQHHDTPTPPLFRAAVDSVYGAEAAEEVPERESEAGEWLGRAAVKEEPAAPEDDPFHAPLKPLPRPDDTDAYPSLSFVPPEQAEARPERPEETTWPPSGEETAWPPSGEETAWPPSGEETAWVQPPDWPRPGAEEPPAAPADEPARADESVRAEARAEVRAEEPPPAPEKAAWADTQPRNERPSWEEPATPAASAAPAAEEPVPAPAEPPRADLPQWAESQDKPALSWAEAPGGDVPQWAAESPETLPRADVPQWAAESPETLPRSDRPQWDEPEGRGQEQRLTWSEQQQDRSHWGERSSSDRAQEISDRAQETSGRIQETAGRSQETSDLRQQRADAPEQRQLRRQRTDQPEHRQRTDQPEWRPAEREIPPPPRRRPAPTPVFTSSPKPPLTGRPTAESLDPESLLRGRRNAPAKGWRRLVYKASGGWIKPGESPEVRRRRELVTRARTPVTAGHHRVAVLSLKGGVGKTTTTVGLGATLAQVRGDRVIAVDANPDRGTLSDKLVLETSATVRDLLNERDQVKRYVDIRAFTSQAPSRLEVLASDRDPSVSEAFSGSDYQAVSQVLENFYSICITDCGTGLLHSAMGGVLGLADQIVLVSSPSVDGARAASATLDWLEAHHYADLVKNATVVLCSVRPRSKSAVDIKKLEAHFAARCRAVIRVPYDPHLEEGAEIDLDRLQEPTRDAYLQLAACVGDGFAGIRE